MFSHVMLGVNDLEVSKNFYDAVLGTLGMGPGLANKSRYVYLVPVSELRFQSAQRADRANSERPRVVDLGVA